VVETVGRQYAFIKFGECAKNQLYIFEGFGFMMPVCASQTVSSSGGDESLQTLSQPVTQSVCKRYAVEATDCNTYLIIHLSIHVSAIYADVVCLYAQDLGAVAGVMRRTIDDVLDRGAKLEGSALAPYSASIPCIHIH
jgi:hypothetical protein